MNHIYRLKRSGRKQLLQPVPETARSVCKGQTRTGSAAAWCQTLAGLVSGVVAGMALGGILTLVHAQQAPPLISQLPQGGVVSRGRASISSGSTPTGTALMTVNQTSNRAVIDWASFNVGSQAKVQFNQPSSSAVVLNQVLGNNASQIYGQISANGQVILSNPNGIYFSPTASVDVGSLVATTGKANADEFMAGTTRFARDGSTASVVNEGQLKAALGGYIALLAPEVRNQGIVIAQAGTVALATGEAVTLNFNTAGTGLTGITTTPQAIAALVENRSAVLAEGGQIILSAHALATLNNAVVKNSGQLSATSLSEKGGKIVLMGERIELTGTSQIEANGPQGGGTVLVGGDWQGSGDTRQAVKVTMAPGASIEANATQQGDGGKVVLWSDVRNADSVTRVEGRIEAKGAGTGNGGRIETSGHGLNITETARIDAGGGDWLLDPYDVTLSAVGGSGTSSATVSSTTTYTANANDAVVNVSTIQTALNAGTSITVTTGSGGTQSGNITVASDITWTSAKILTLQAAGGVTGSATITTGTSASYVAFDQAGDSTYSGIIAGAGGVRKLGAGTLTLTGDNTYTGSTSFVAGKLNMGSSSAFGPSGALNFSGGTLQYSSASSSFDFTTGPVRTNAVASAYSIDTNGENVLLAGGLIATASIGSLTKLGSGTLTLGYANGYYGVTTISAGTLAINSTGTLGNSGSGGVTVASGAVLDLQNRLTSGYITLNGGTFKTSTGYSTLQASGSWVALGTGGGIFDVALGATLVINPIVSGSTSLTKQGTGTLTLSGTNTNAGSINITAGTLKLGNAQGLGTGSTGVVTVSAGAALDLNGYTLTSANGKGLSLTGTGVSSGGALLNSSASAATYTGLLTLAGDTLISGGTGLIALSNTGTVVGGGYNLTLGGALGGSLASVLDTSLATLTKQGAGTWTLTGANSYTGDTTISAGTLQIGNGTITTTTVAPSNVANSGTLTFNAAAAATLTSANTISGTGVVKISGNSTGSTVLQGDNTFSGGVTITTGTTLVAGLGSTGVAGAVTSGPLGTGTLTMTANNAKFNLAGYNFANNIASTTVTASTAASLVLSSGASQISGTLDVSGGSAVLGLTPAAGATITLTGTANNNAGDFSSSVSKLYLNGAGSVVARFASVPNRGIIGVSAGTWTVDNTLSGSSFGLNLSGGTFDLAGYNLSAASNGKLFFNGGTLTNSSLTKSNVLVGNMNVNADFTISTPNVGGDIDLSAINFVNPPVTTKTMTKTGAGDVYLRPTMFLSGGVDYNVTVNAGNLRYSNTSGYDLKGIYTLPAGSTLYVNANFNITGTITGDGAVVVGNQATTPASGASTTFSGANTYTGGTTVLGKGVLTLGRAPVLSGSTIVSSPVGTGNVTLGDSSTSGQITLGGYNLPHNIFVNGTAYIMNSTASTNAVVSGVIADGSNTGQSLTFYPAATSSTLEVSGNNTYTGLTSVNNYSNTGALVISHNNALGSSAQGTTLVSNTANTIKLKGGITVSEPVTLTASTTLGNLSGNNTLTGSVTVSGASTFSSDAGTLTLTPAAGNAISAGANNLTFNGAGNLSITGKISGSGTVTKSGTGSVAFSGDNDFTGAITVSAGILRAASNTALGTTAGGITVANGATLELGGPASPSGLSISTEALTVNDGGAIHNVAGYNYYAGAMTLGGAATITVDSGTTLNFTATGAAISVAANKRITFNLTDGDLTIAKGLTGGAGSSYLKTGSGTLTTGPITTLTPVIGVYAGLYDPSGSDYSTVYGSTPDLTYAFYSSAAGTSTVTFTGYSGTVTWTGTKPVAGSAAGSYALTYSSGLTVTNTAYALLGATNAKTWTVTPKALTLTGLSAPSSKAYDGTTTATVSGTAGLLAAESVGSGSSTDGKPYTGDTITISGTATGTYNTQNVATANLVTFGGLSSSNSNYTLTGSQAATITAKALTVQGLSVPATKVYDATRTATVTGAPGLLSAQAPGAGSASDGTPYTGDVINITGTPTGTYNTQDVSTANLVTLAGMTSSNSNYTLTGTLAASITTKALTLTGLSAPASRSYDATTTAVVSGTPGLLAAQAPGAGSASDGKPYTGDTVNISGSATGTYDSKDVASATTIIWGGLSSSNSNYTVQGSQAAAITPKSLTVTGLSVPTSRVYDATNDAVVSGTAGLLAAQAPGAGSTSDGKPYTGDTINISGSATATYNSKDVASATRVTFGGLTLDNGNYSLTGTQSATLTPKALTLQGLSVPASRSYDGTLSASVTGTPVVLAAQAPGSGSSSDGTPYTGDSIAITGSATGTYNSANVTSANLVTFGGLNPNNSNYTLQGSQAASISTATLSISGSSIASKTYDGTTTAVVTVGTLSGLAGTETLSVTGSGAFGSPNVGSYTINTTYTLADAGSGASAGLASNYVLANQNLTGSITAKSLGLSVPGASRVYDGTTSISLSPGAVVTLTGVVGSDDVGVGVGSVTGFVDKNVGAQKPVVYTGFSLTGSTASNYSLPVHPVSTAEITAADLAVSGVSAVSRVYNAGTNASLSGTAVVSALLSDVVTVNSSAVSATFADKNVGTGKAVTVSGYTLSGTDAGNYNVLQPTGLTANITPASLSVTGVTAVNKVYDATRTATLLGTAAVTGLLTDDVSLTGTVAASFADKNVGTAKPVTVTGYALTGTDAANYSVLQPAGLSADITKADLQITGVGAVNKVYDATRAATLSGTATVTGLLTDDVSLSGSGTGTFANKNVGTGKAVTVTGYSLNGADVGNYNLLAPAGVTADITPASLTVNGISANSKTYDGDTTATLNLAGVQKIGLLGSDVVTVTAVTGTFDSANAGTGKTVTLSAHHYGGADAGNYTITDQTSTIANIDRKLLGLNIPGASRIYDGTTTITLSPGAVVSLDGVVGSDDVNMGAGALIGFLDKNVGVNKLVTYSGFNLAGNTASNYSLPVNATSTGTITAAPLSISGMTAANKTYDGNTTATVSATGVLMNGLVVGDTVTVASSGVFADKNAGNGKTVTLTNNYAGADAGNYTITDQSSTTADISQATLTISGITAAHKTYDGNPNAVVSTAGLVKSGLVVGDTVTVSSSGVFTDKNAAPGKTVTLSNSIGGADVGNYAIVDQTTTTANITPAVLTISGSSAASKTYDGNTNAAITAGTLNGLVGTESLTVTGAASFAGKNVGNYTLNTAYTLADAGTGASAGLASNYTLANQNLSASISAKTLTISGITAANKTYNGNSTATVSTALVAKNGLVDGDTVTVTSSGVFADKNVGTGKTVTLTNTYAGADAGNYAITDQTTATANIAQAALTISGITAANKTYDGNTSATVSTGSVVKSGLIAGDTVTVASSGVFADKNAATGKTVTLTNTYAGADAGNYAITDQTTATAPA